MQNVTKTAVNRFLDSKNAVFQRVCVKSVSAAVADAELSSLLLTGCFWRSKKPAVNEVILASGHAKTVYIKPNQKYADDFRKYEKQHG